ncbi:MAG: hypothetical protein FWD49_06950 [Firmicutes bacterium]|nr:hypothetical protein [Bacillota bacterium]
MQPQRPPYGYPQQPSPYQQPYGAPQRPMPPVGTHPAYPPQQGFGQPSYGGYPPQQNQFGRQGGSPQGGGKQGKQPKAVKPGKDDSNLTLGQWIKTFLWCLLVIPPIAWFFGASKFTARTRYVRASFIVGIIMSVLSVVLVIVMAMLMADLLPDELKSMLPF